MLTKKYNPKQSFSAKTKIYLEKSAEEILPIIGKDFSKKIFYTKMGEFLVKMNSDRLECFKRNHICVVCGIEGNHFQLEAPSGTETPHWNFYHKDGEKLILMTKDHIVPISKHGEDNLNNLQTMCIICNNEKGNKK